ncbi:MAG: hypothetical protein U0V74_08800 [Chitinophagales bacterium]
MKAALNSFLVALLLAMLFLPVGYYCISENIPLKPLAGENVNSGPLKPQLQDSTLLSGSYQDSLSLYAEHFNPVRNLLTRVYSQLMYSVFHDCPGYVRAGDYPYLFTSGYLDAWTGTSCPGDSILEIRFKKVDSLNQWLNKRGKKLLVVLAPGKATFDSGHAPDFYKRHTLPVNTYSIVKHLYEGSDIPFIDLQAYFLKIKDTCRYALYPKQGEHWSLYGASLGYDSICRKMEHLLNKELIQVTYGGGYTSVKDDYKENDVYELLNLFSAAEPDTLFYPWFSDKAGTAGKYRPRVLLIGDSYVWPILKSYVTYNISPDSRYWWHLDTQWALSGPYLEPVPISTLNIEEEINRFDIVVFLFTEINYASFDEQLYDRIILSERTKR